MSRGKSLELLRPDPNTGKVYTLLTVDTFGVIRSLMAFRLTGGSKGKNILHFYIIQIDKKQSTKYFKTCLKKKMVALCGTIGVPLAL